MTPTAWAGSSTRASMGAAMKPAPEPKPPFEIAAIRTAGTASAKKVASSSKPLPSSPELCGLIKPSRRASHMPV